MPSPPNIPSPALSVVVASYNSRATISACLASLRKQAKTPGLEIIVVDSSDDGTADWVGKIFPEVRLVHLQGRHYPGSARNAALALAQAPVVALVDADCTVPPDWSEKVVAAHQNNPDLAIGGVVANVAVAGPVGWASYFCEFSQWMPAGMPRAMDDVAGASMTYKKEVFERYGKFIEGTYCSDTEFHWRLKKDGHRIFFTPGIQVTHHSVESLLRYLSHEFAHGRFFARVRCQFGGLSGVRRFVYGMFSPCFFLVVLARTLGRVLACAEYRKHLISAWPGLMLGVGCWCAGEAMGYLELDEFR